MTNPRYANGNLRRKHRERLRAMGCECGICHWRFGPIHYDEPSNAQHPLSFVVDEIRPVSKWRQFGYPSARAAAEDWTNLQAAHYFCNAQKGNKTGQNSPKTGKKGAKPCRIPQVSDGVGWGGSPSRRPRRLRAVQRRFTHRKFFERGIQTWRP